MPEQRQEPRRVAFFTPARARSAVDERGPAGVDAERREGLSHRAKVGLEPLYVSASSYVIPRRTGPTEAHPGRY